MKKKLFLLLASIMTFVSVSCSGSHKTIEREFDNIIVVIGDGMGMNHILNAIDYFDLETPVFIEDQCGYIKTNSLDGTTDSAAGGTALATGKKVHNSNVAMLDGEDLEQITTIANSVGMKTGVITTDVLNGATPAAFSGHSESRDLGREILESQSTSGIHLFMGMLEPTYPAYDNLFIDNGYTFLNARARKASSQLAEVKNSKKLLAMIEDVTSEYIDDYAAQFSYQLDDMVKFGVEFLENEKGFFLMVEGAYIDKNSHGNGYHGAMCEVRSLIDTIEFLYEYAADGRTAIFITADHETGGLQRYVGQTNDLDSLFTTTGHTSIDVPLFVKNYTLDLSDYQGTYPENTIIFETCKSIILGR